MRGAEGRDLGVHVGSQNVWLTLDQATVKHRRAVDSKNDPSIPRERLRFEIHDSPSGDTARCAWEDDETSTLERKLDEIVVEIILAGELRYREYLEAVYEWRVKRRAELEEEVRRRSAEQARGEGDSRFGS